jgi:HD-GYP domain-containing protein (c-di-GMP phosphodiesterase class II)
MTSGRPYRGNRMSQQAVLDEMTRNRGTQFDPHILDAFFHCLSEGAIAFPSTDPDEKPQDAP